MKKTLTILILLLAIQTVLVPVQAERKQKSQIPVEKATEVRQILYQTGKLMEKYPDARFLDIYEYWAEAIMGPNHNVKDTVSLSEVIMTTIKNASDTMLGPDYEYIGTTRKYVRVNLRLIRDGKIPLREYVSAVLDTEYAMQPYDIEKWKSEWWLINTAIKESDLYINTTQFEEDIVTNALNQGKMRPTTSALLPNGYHYYYYLVSLKQFREQLLKFFY